MPGRKPKSKDRSASTKTKIHPNAAGVDLGSRSHFVALPADRNEPVRQFGCFTQDLEEMAQWLLSHRIETVAMEATGVYWIPVFQVLETAGLDVQLVNAYHYRNVPGRKTDVQDCQWLQYLHECGLVRGSFCPKDDVCVLRTYARQRETWTEESSRHLQRMQKALEQMNVQLHKVLSSIAGVTGLAIIKAILAGERSPEALLKYRDKGCKYSEGDFVKALTGDWREEHLFCLKQELHAYETAQEHIVACEEACKEALAKLETRELPPEDLKTPRKMDPEMHRLLYQATGIDLLAAEGFGDTIASRLIAEVGTDMSPWPTEKHFASWARVCPANNITGGKRRRVIGSPKTNRVRQIFKQAAQTLARAKSGLGAYYRSVRLRRGAPTANAATAHKLARIFYRIMKFGEAYRKEDAARYEERYRERTRRGAINRLKQLGYDVQLTETAPVPAGG
jgi:transposase